MKLFKTKQNKAVNSVRYSFKILKEYPGCKVYVGSDSQKVRGGVSFATVIAYRYGTRGCHFIYRKDHIRFKQLFPKRKGSKLIEWRLLKEVEDTMAAATWLLENNIKVDAVEFDLNEDHSHKSNAFVQHAKGWALGMGFKAITKPEEQIAVKAANHLV